MKNILLSTVMLCLLFTACGNEKLGGSYFTALVDGQEYLYPNYVSEGEFGGETDSYRFDAFSIGAGAKYDWELFEIGSITVEHSLHEAGSYSILNSYDYIDNDKSEKVITLSIRISVEGYEGEAVYEVDNALGVGTARVTMENDEYHVSVDKPLNMRKIKSEMESDLPLNIQITVTDMFTKNNLGLD